MPTEDPTKGLYDLFLMGLAWLREDNPEVLERRGASVFSSYERANPVFQSARRLVEVSWDLAEMLCAYSVVHEGERPPGKRALRQLIAESEMHNIVLAVPQQGLEPDKLFGAGGYRHVITDAGIAYAMSVAGPYEQIVSCDTFLQGWARHKAQMKSLNAKNPLSSQAEGNAESSDMERGEESRYIQPAVRREEDFDW